MLNSIKTNYYDSTNDLGGAAFLDTVGYTGPGGTPYVDALQFNSPTGVFLPANYKALVSPYLFPNSPTDRAVGAAINPTQEDSTVNNQGILKLQYTHNFSESALFRVYGYTYYSNWLQNGPQSTYSDFVACCSSDYELSCHTRGLSGSLIDQINSQNLLQLQGSYTTSNSLRDNNEQMFESNSTIGYVVDSTHPTDGFCYAVTGGPAISCSDATAGTATLKQASTGSITPATGVCGGGPCEYFVTGNGQDATYNTVKPIFYSGSLTDDFHPTSKLSINGGIRMDIFQFQGSDTTGTPARAFFYNAFNLDNCLTATGTLVAKEPTVACPAGSTVPNLTNPTGIVTESYTEFQPRLGATYTVDPSTVLRVGYGRYAQAPNSAYEQYNYLQQNAPASLAGFLPFGFTSPDHDVRPGASNNYDFSVEHQFPGQLSLKISPFYRKTQDQIQEFYLDQKTGFVSGLNVGDQTGEGVEFELDKGDFARDGLAAKLSFTYTNSFINYQKLANGTTIITQTDQAISNYNAYTKACAAGGADVGKSAYGIPLCGATTSGVAASPCYTPATAAASGTPVACTGATISNPYWDAPAQGLIDPSSDFRPFDLFPAGVGSSVNAMERHTPARWCSTIRRDHSR